MKEYEKWGLQINFYETEYLSSLEWKRSCMWQWGKYNVEYLKYLESILEKTATTISEIKKKWHESCWLDEFDFYEVRIYCKQPKNN